MLVRSGEDTACIANLAYACPIASVIDEFLPWPDDMHPQGNAQILRHALCRIRPVLTAKTSKQRKCTAPRQIKRRMLAPFCVVDPSMRQTRAGAGGGLIVQVCILREGGHFLPIAHDRV